MITFGSIVKKTINRGKRNYLQELAQPILHYTIKQLAKSVKVLNI